MKKEDLEVGTLASRTHEQVWRKVRLKQAVECRRQRSR